MKTHVKILAVLYGTFSLTLGVMAALALLISLFGKDPILKTFGAALMFASMSIWFSYVAHRLWFFRQAGWTLTLVTAVVLMLVLNGVLLIKNSIQFAGLNRQKVFHLACMAIGLYTVVVLLLPTTRRAFSGPSERLFANFQLGDKR